MKPFFPAAALGALLCANAPALGQHGTAGHAPPAHVSAQTDPAQLMTAIMKQTWDRPDSPLLVHPVVIEGDAAVLGWRQEGRGGRALFRKRSSGWIMVLCAGAELKSEAGLMQAGVAAGLARILAHAVVRAESALAPGDIARFDSFEGVVVMDQHGGHPPGHGAPAASGGHRH